MKKVPALLFAVVALIGMGVAVATIPDNAGVIHGCYKTADGKLRVIDSPTESCGSGETAIQWNQIGPVGPTGPAAILDVEYVSTTHAMTVAPPTFADVFTAVCPSGEDSDRWWRRSALHVSESASALPLQS